MESPSLIMYKRLRPPPPDVWKHIVHELVVNLLHARLSILESFACSRAVRALEAGFARGD